jgi:hypothetical protein
MVVASTLGVKMSGHSPPQMEIDADIIDGSNDSFDHQVMIRDEDSSNQSEEDERPRSDGSSESNSRHKIMEGTSVFLGALRTTLETKNLSLNETMEI